MAIGPNSDTSIHQTRPLSPHSASTSSRASSRVKQHLQTPLLDVTSDRDTDAFVKGVLRPTSSGNLATPSDAAISDILPPLTSSNDIDLQLYAYIALIVKQCVQSWYERFTPDQVFVDEIIQVIAHCTRGLEERARKTDLETLLFDDIPALLHAHVTAYRMSLTVAPVGSNIDQQAVYHALRPHPALPGEIKSHLKLEEDGDDDVGFKDYCHLLAQGLLSVLLPPGDLQNPCLRAMISEVSADLIIGNYIGLKFTDSAFIYDMIRRTADITLYRLHGKRWAVDIQDEPKDRLSQFGLLSKGSTAGMNRTSSQKLSDMLVMIGQYTLLLLTWLKCVFAIFASGSSLPGRRYVGQPITKASATTSAPEAMKPIPESKDTHIPPAVKPIVQYAAWAALSEIACLETRMPWAMSSLMLLDRLLSKTFTGFSNSDGRIDRILAHYIIRPIFPLSRHLPTILRNLRLALFPGHSFPTGTGTTTTSPLDPSARAALAARSKRAAAFAILNCIPRPLSRTYLCTTSPASDVAAANETSPYDDPVEKVEQAEVEAMVSDISDTVLEPFSNDYMNRHLVLAILERVIVALVPELGRDEDMGKAVAELLAERGVDVEDGLQGESYDDSAGEGLGFHTQGRGKAQKI